RRCFRWTRGFESHQRRDCVQTFGAGVQSTDFSRAVPCTVDASTVEGTARLKSVLSTPASNMHFPHSLSVDGIRSSEGPNSRRLLFWAEMSMVSTYDRIVQFEHGLRVGLLPSSLE